MAEPQIDIIPFEGNDGAIASTVVDHLSHPGVIITVEPDQADELGVFIEDALSADTAWASRHDDQVEEA